MNEQAVAEAEVNNQVTGFADVLSEALKGEGEAPRPQPTEEGSKSSTPEEKLYAELVVKEGEKLGFKSDKEFFDFLDKNKILKDGFLRQQDYTRKTQELSNERKQIEQFVKEQQGFWGEARPDENSLSALKAIWTAYQKGSPEYQQALNKLVQDAYGISQGSPAQPAQTYVPDPRVDELNNKVKQFESYFEKLEYDKALNEWESFKSHKAKEGIQLADGDETSRMMAHFLSFVDPKTGKPFTLDKAYQYAVRELGKEQNDAVKKVFSGANEAKRKSPSAPSSGASSVAKPEPKTFGEILAQGMEAL